MKKIITSIITVLLTMAILCTSLPLAIFADAVKEQGGNSAAKAETADADSLGYFVLSDDNISVRISKNNAGYYLSTLEGDVISKTDNNSDLTYMDETFDTSFTSFRVTRNGKAQDYIFGRDYTHLGIPTSDVNVYKSADNAVVAEWTVDGILFKQTISLMGNDTYQHGMIYIAYTAKNTTDKPIDSIQARVMMDTALGKTDYAYYMLAQKDGSYTAIEEEKTVSGDDYYNYFFAYDSKTSPTVTSYTLNANINGEMIVPSKVTFAHWYNLASNVFDYAPSKDNPLKYTELYGSIDHLTQDSAVALYYDMPNTASEENGSTIALYYGVYSNYNAGDADVALNFTTSGNMFFDESGESYKDMNGTLPGNFSTTFKIQNIADEDIPKLAVAIYPEEEIRPYEGNKIREDITTINPYYKVIEELKVGEVNDVRFDFKIDPTVATGYRKIKVAVYNISASETLSDANTVLEDEYFVLCPGAQGASVGFTEMTPDTVFMKGVRYAYITGSNFSLIRDKSQYRILLRPHEGGDDIVLDMDKVVVNTELNMATLVLDMEIAPGTYDVVIDWNDVTIEDMTSDVLRIMVTDIPSPGDPGYVSSGVYGIGAIVRDGRHYDIVKFNSEQDFKDAKLKPEDVMIVIKGNVNFLSSVEQGNFKAEAVTLMEGETVLINDTLEVRDGRVTVTKNFDSEGKQTEITVDIDGKVYTTKANTKIWEGVLAITSFKEGNLYTLPVYSEQGELSIRDGEEGGERITLLWPGAAGVAQTLVGLLVTINFGEFALMKQGDEYARVISFGASLDPSILIPSGRLGTQRYYSDLEKKQREMGVGNYTAEQLRANDTKFKKKQAEWRKEQAGTLNLYMDDILFGAGGFIGFNTQIEVGIPSYAAGMPYIEGTLSLKVINDYWEFGVEGSADMMLFEMEAALKLKSYKGIPIPDTIYFFIGGVKPGIPVDPFGAFWIRGAGAGISNLYDTFFGTDRIPPITLLIKGEFAIFNILSATAELSLSPQGIAGYLNDVGINGITIIDRVGGSIYWYPGFSLSFGMRIDIFDAIVGEGAIVVKDDDEGFYFGAYAKATVKIPDKIFLIGGIKIGEAAIGIDTDKVWGSVKVIGIGVGLVYYWGGDLDVSVGRKLSVPEPIMAFSPIPVKTDPETGETLYVAITNDIKLLQATTSSDDKLSHTVTLDARPNEDILMSVTYSADNKYMAEDIKNALKIKLGEEDYALEYFNMAYDADSEANAGTNAVFRYDEESKVATVSVSFTNAADYGKTVSIETATASEIETYTIVKAVAFDSVEMNSEKTSVELKGSGLDKLSSLTVYAEDESNALYLLGEYDTATIAEGAETLNIDVEIPAHLPTGTYTLRAIGAVVDEAGVAKESPMVDSSFEYTNPDQPSAPTLAQIELAGDYSVILDTKADCEHDGFLTNVYEVTSEGYKSTMFADIVTDRAENSAIDDNASILLGGRYSSTDENEVTTYVGLEAGKKYVVSVQSFKTMSDGSKLLSKPTVSNEITMVMPIKVEPTFSIENAVGLKVGLTNTTVDTVNQSSFTIKVAENENIANGKYKLGDGEFKEWDGKDIAFTDLEDGTYTLTVEGRSTTNDKFNALYQFCVDTKAPSMLVSSPSGGGFFSGSKLLVTGISEVGAKIVASVVGGKSAETVAAENGAFSVEIEVDETFAYQDIRIFAYDAVGNESMPFGCTVTNAMLANDDLKAVILYGGEEINELVCTSEAKQLQMVFKSGDNYITVNENSSAANNIKWSVQTISKSASVTPDGKLSGSNGAEGIVLVSLGSKSAYASMVSIDLADIDVVPVIPEGGLIYDGTEKKPELKFGTDEALEEGVDYTLSYANNVNAGLATVIVSALEGGKCTGVAVVSFTIKARDIAEVELTHSADDDDNPIVKLVFDGKELVEGTDYKLTVKKNSDGSSGVITVEGIGNFKGFISEEYEYDSFDHLVWIIPTATFGGLALICAILAIIKHIRKKKRKLEGGETEKTVESDEAEETVESDETVETEKSDEVEDAVDSESSEENDEKETDSKE